MIDLFFTKEEVIGECLKMQEKGIIPFVQSKWIPYSATLISRGTTPEQILSRLDSDALNDEGEYYIDTRWGCITFKPTDAQVYEKSRNENWGD